jgi:hypothetical protein
MSFAADREEAVIPGKRPSGPTFGRPKDKLRSADPGSMPGPFPEALRNGSRIKPGMTTCFLANARSGSL